MSTIDRLLAAYYAIHDILNSNRLSADAVNAYYNEVEAIVYHIGYLLGTRKLENMKMDIARKLDNDIEVSKFDAGYQSGTLTRPRPIKPGGWNPWEAAGLG
jgi:hypothetical protein